jgi:quinol-cytochrome oxidoreductase complex cytochrome b subunit
VSLPDLALVIMIVTGIVLAMNYTAHVDHAFQLGRADHA